MFMVVRPENKAQYLIIPYLNVSQLSEIAGGYNFSQHLIGCWSYASS